MLWSTSHHGLQQRITMWKLLILSARQMACTQNFRHKYKPPQHRKDQPSKSSCKPPKCKPREHAHGENAPKQDQRPVLQFNIDFFAEAHNFGLTTFTAWIFSDLVTAILMPWLLLFPTGLLLPCCCAQLEVAALHRKVNKHLICLFYILLNRFLGKLQHTVVLWGSRFGGIFASKFPSQNG